MKKLWIGILVVLILIASALILVPGPYNPTFRQVKTYDSFSACLAINDPACGYCPGKVVSDKCYVRKGTSKQYE